LKLILIVTLGFGTLCLNLNLSNQVFAADYKTHQALIVKNTQNPGIDSRTMEILKQMTQFISINNNFTFKAEIMYDDMNDPGQKLQISGSEKVFIQKPAKIFMEYNTDYSSDKLLYNLNTVTLLDSTTNLYTKIEVPESINHALDYLSDMYGYAPPLSDFFYLYPYKKMIENVRASSYVGSSVVFGVRCHHLVFEEKDKDWQIWIEDGKRKLPRKLVITYKNVPGSPQFIAILKDWILNEPFSPKLFEQKLTKNAGISQKSLFKERSENNLGVIRTN